MSRRALRNIAAALVLASIPGSAPSWAPGWVGGPSPIFWPFPRSLSDPRLEAERKASVAWETRTGPKRQVVDLVCVVPDVATFFAAIAAWDERHYFPILIDDPEYSLRFLRAFRPARIVQFPRRVLAIPDERLWPEAVKAAGRAWVGSGRTESEAPLGDRVPTRLGPTPPGIVVSSPASPTLCGALALAAGRFQPLL